MKILVDRITSCEYLGCPNHSKSSGNRLLDVISVIPQLKLPDRVELATDLTHFVCSSAHTQSRAKSPHVQIFEIF